MTLYTYGESRDAVLGDRRLILNGSILSAVPGRHRCHAPHLPFRNDEEHDDSYTYSKEDESILDPILD